MMAYERASVDMLTGITRMPERQTDRPGKSQEEDVTERFRKQGPKEFPDRGTLSSEDDEDQPKSGCKREEKKISLNILKKQPARTRPAQCRPE
ncbi:hypothetical protein F511_14528 [Dorcoceras hygrometricum]|uniref:Uncharacterized protein n=1 Tax=Dorcoceras hygrometricum TaxID=472368 RepID=A0A2Z7ATP4_9LAMI|nr:hypothetical protein F511_14528 [Dorcoceras hygrometricum]